MKFRFCGDADCPDWLLMQINTISTLTVESLEELCANVALSLLNHPLDYSQAQSLTGSSLTELSDVKACVSALRLVLRSAACHQVAPAELSAELEQLGLDRTHSTIITKIFSQNADQLTEKFRNESLRLGRLSATRVAKKGDLYQVEMAVLNEETDKEETKIFSMREDQIKTLIHGLKDIKSRMEDLTKTNC